MEKNRLKNGIFILSALGLFCGLLTLVTVKSVAAGSKAKKLNTQLYEEDSGPSASGKVKAIREIQEETEVFLDSKTGSGGPFVLPQGIKNRASLLKILSNSQKAGGSSVTLKLDDQQRILGVEESAAPATGTGSTSAEKWGL